MNTSPSERMLNASRKRSLRFQSLLGVSVAFLMAVLLSPGFVRAESAIIVKEGKPLMARYRGAAWQETADGLAGLTWSKPQVVAYSDGIIQGAWSNASADLNAMLECFISIT